MAVTSRELARQRIGVGIGAVSQENRVMGVAYVQQHQACVPVGQVGDVVLHPDVVQEGARRRAKLGVDVIRPVELTRHGDLFGAVGLGDIDDMHVLDVVVIDQDHVGVVALLPDKAVVHAEVQVVLLERPRLGRVGHVPDGHAALSRDSRHAVGLQPGQEDRATRLVGGHQDLAVEVFCLQVSHLHVVVARARLGRNEGHLGRSRGVGNVDHMHAGEVQRADKVIESAQVGIVAIGPHVGDVLARQIEV
ncbi:MAG TPA: hypothetical protein VIS10_14960 [Anaerolineales bacterium]